MRSLVALLAGTMLLSAAAAAAGEPTPVAPVASGDEPESRVVVYYFYGKPRCTTCRNLEAYARAAIRAGFGAELEAGRLEWRPVDTDREENEHYIEEFELFTKAVVLVELRGSKRVRWKSLERIWLLVPFEDQYKEYIRDEVTAFLEGADG